MLLLFKITSEGCPLNRLIFRYTWLVGREAETLNPTTNATFQCCVEMDDEIHGKIIKHFDVQTFDVLFGITLEVMFVSHDDTNRVQV